MANGLLSKRDSVETYSNQWDRYNVSNHPDADKARKRLLEIQREQGKLDKVSADRKKLEQDILERFEKLTQDIKSGRVHFTVQVVKLMLLVAALPPYFACVRIPGWILTKGLPQAFEALLFCMKPVGKMLLKLRGKIEHLINQIALPVAKVVQLVKSFAKSMNTFLKGQLQRMVGEPLLAITKFLRKNLESVKLPKIALPNVFSRLPNLFQFVPNLVKPIKQVISLTQTIVKPLTKAVHTILTPVRAAIQIVSDVQLGLNKSLAAAAQGTAHLINKFTQAAKERLAPVVKGVEIVAGWMEKATKPLTTAKEYLAQKTQAIKEFGEQVVQQLSSLMTLPAINLFIKEPVFLKRQREKFKRSSKKKEKKPKKFRFARAVLRTVKDVFIGAFTIQRGVSGIIAFIISKIKIIINRIELILRDIFYGVQVVLIGLVVLLKQFNQLLRDKSGKIIYWLKEQQVKS